MDFASSFKRTLSVFNLQFWRLWKRNCINCLKLKQKFNANIEFLCKQHLCLKVRKSHVLKCLMKQTIFILILTVYIHIYLQLFITGLIHICTVSLIKNFLNIIFRWKSFLKEFNGFQLCISRNYFYIHRVSPFCWELLNFIIVFLCKF